MENQKNTLENLLADNIEAIKTWNEIKSLKEGFVININDLMFHSGDAQPALIRGAKVYETRQQAERDMRSFKWRNGAGQVMKPKVELAENFVDRCIEALINMNAHIESEISQLNMVTLTQDGRDKITVTKSEATILESAKLFFRWRKNITMKRVYGLGSHNYNNFIEYLSK